MLLTLWMLIGASLLGYAVYRALYAKVVVYQGQAGLLIVDGKQVRRLLPGRYRIYRRRAEVVIVDLRERLLTVAGQKPLSGDHISLRVTLAIAFTVEDPQAALAVQDFTQSLYLAAQLALRKAVIARSVEELLDDREGLLRELATELGGEAARLGLVLRRAELKNVTLPGPLKQAFADELRARKEGAAALERARAESAALRNLANAARTLDENPNLYPLRVLQSLTPKNKLVLKVKP